MKIKKQSYKFNNVYIKNTATILSPNEKNSIVSKYVDFTMDDLYFGEKSFEAAEFNKEL